MTSVRSVLQVMSPEFRLVVACSWVPRDTERHSSEIAALAAGPLDWEQVAELVVRHGVTGLFCLNMGLRDWAGVPDGIQARIKTVRLQQAARTLGQVAELSRIAEAFAIAGIELIPLKGVALSQELYGDPLVRTSGDLDILVHGQDVAEAEDLLRRLDYRHALGFHGLGARQQGHIIDNLHHHEYLNDAKGSMVELHWRGYLWTEEQVAPPWAASLPADGPGVTVRRLAREDNILFLADHGARHEWECLKWLSDLAMLTQLLSPDDWRSLYERAACFDLQRVLLQTALMLERVYGIAPPADFSSLAAADRVVKSLTESAVSQLLATKEELAARVKRFAGPRQALRIRALKPGTPVSALVCNVLIKPEDFLEYPLPDSLFWLYIPLRPYFWFKRHYLAGRRK